MNIADAREIAASYLSRQNYASELVLLDDQTLSTDYGWVFFYASLKFLKTGNLRDQIIGNAPFIVDKVSGEITVTGTALPVEIYLQEYHENKARASKNGQLSAEIL
jgi:hypothetical protein